MPTPISNFSLEQKIGQIMLVGFDGTTLAPDLRDTLAQLHIGGVIYYDRNIASPNQVAQLNRELQTLMRANGDAPLFITIDQEGGIVARLKEEKGFTEFPSQMAVAATNDLDNARRIAEALSAEMLALGFNMDLTPDLDVNNNANNPIIGTRAFSSDPQRVAEYGVAYIRAMQAAGMLAVAKHFPGHGDTATDSHVALSSVPHDRARLEAVEFVPFKAAMRAPVAGIMSAHITFPAIDPTPGLAGTLSSKVLTDLLRGEMQYAGLVMTDELTMGAIAASGYPAPRAAVAALQAGADVLLFQTGYAMHRQAHQAIGEALQRGEVSLARLEQAVERVWRAKAQFGILEDRGEKINPARVGTPELKTLSRAVAAQAITLLRDDARRVPIQPGAKLLVIETGNYGIGAALGATTLRVNAQPVAREIAGAVSAARDHNLVIFATTDVAKNRAQADLVAALIETNTPTIIVATRSPYDCVHLPAAPTYLATYGNTPPMLDALIAILTGNAQPRGRLPVELPGFYKLGEGM